MPPNAQSLVLDMLSAMGGRATPVRALVGVAEVFGISGNNLRVALARLVADGKVGRSGRGLYGMTGAAGPIQRWVSSWPTREERLVGWRGGWVAAHVGGLSGAERKSKARRERALGFLGMRALDRGLYLRPDNLRGGVARVRVELGVLGLEPEATVFSLSELDDETDARARGLWDAAALQRGYQQTNARLETSGGRLNDLPLEQAMVECFELGGRAIRQLAYDPLLPEPIVQVRLRRELIERMRRYDRLGRRIWQRFMRAQGAPALESLLGFHQLGRVA